jgi:tetratricopeptide (TPR) repeat protein
LELNEVESSEKELVGAVDPSLSGLWSDDPVTDLSMDELLIQKSLDPTNRETGTCLAGLYIASGELQLAIDELRMLWLQYPQDDSLTLEIARLYARKSEFNRAFEFYEQCLKLSPSHRNALSEYGRLLVQNQRKEGAIPVLERFKLLQPSDSQVYLLLSDAYLHNGETGRAVENLKQALKQFPDNSQVRIQLARILESQNLYEQAISLLTHLASGLESGSLARDRLSILVDCYIGESRYDLATEVLEKYRVQFAQDPSILQKLILLNTKLELWDEVEESYLKRIELEPGYEAYRSLAEFYTDREDYEKLEKHLVAGLEIFSRQPDLHSRLALLYKEDDPEKSMDSLEKAMTLSRDPIESWHYLKGELLIRLGHHPQALQWFASMKEAFPGSEYDERVEELIERDRRYKLTYRILKKANQSLEKGQYRKALSHYRELVRLVPDNPVWLEQLGNLCSVETYYAEAYECFEKATGLLKPERRPALYEKMFSLAYVYGDFERANECGEFISVGASREVDFEIQKLRNYRHLLAEKAYPLEHFEQLMMKFQRDGEKGGSPVAKLCNGFSYLYLGSHLLDSDLWGSQAKKIFNNFLGQKEFHAFFSYAYEGLYLVHLMDYDSDELLGLLKTWVRLDGRESVRSLYLEELYRRGDYSDGVQFIEDLLQSGDQPLNFRFMAQRFAFAFWKSRGGDAKERTQHLKTLQLACSNDPTDHLVYFDLGIGLYFFMGEEPDEQSYYRISQAMKKALKLSQDRVSIQIYMLKVMEYAGRLNRQEKKLTYGKKRIFLEKALAKRPDNEFLILEMGRLCLSYEQDLDLGARCLLKALAMAPELNESNLYLGNYYFEQHEFKKAYHYYLKVIERPTTMRVWSEVVERMQRMI